MSLTRVQFCSLVALGLASLAGGMALAQGDTRTERIQFKAHAADVLVLPRVDLDLDGGPRRGGPQRYSSALSSLRTAGLCVAT